MGGNTYPSFNDIRRYAIINACSVRLTMQSVLLFLEEHKNTVLKLLFLAAFAVPFLWLYLLLIPGSQKLWRKIARNNFMPIKEPQPPQPNLS